jgi:hypothetical protein
VSRMADLNLDVIVVVLVLVLVVRGACSYSYFEESGCCYRRSRRRHDHDFCHPKSQILLPFHYWLCLSMMLLWLYQNRMQG